VKLQLGGKSLRIGRGANPEVGRKAALEDTEKIIEALEARNDFSTAGLVRRYRQRRARPVVARLRVNSAH